MKRIAGFFLIVAAIGCIFGSLSFSAELLKIKVGMSTLSTVWLPIWVADKEGFFREAGLDAQLVAFQSGGQATAGLASGDIDILGGAGNRGITAREKGMKVKAILAQNDGFFFQLMVRSDLAAKVKSVKDLEGMKIAVKPGALSDQLLRFVLRKTNVNAEIVGVPNEQAELAAIQRKQVDAVMTGEPTGTIYEIKGTAKSLIDFRNTEQLNSLGWNWLVPNHVLTVIAKDDYVEKNLQTVQKAMNAISKALKLIDKNPEVAVKTWLKVSPGGGEQEVTERSVKSLSRGWSKDGKVTREGMDNLQTLMVASGEIKEKLPSDQVADTRFIK